MSSTVEKSEVSSGGKGSSGSGPLRAYLKRLIYSKKMLWGIGLASFLEAIIVPIPLETILIPLMQARRKQMWIISAVVWAACIVAALCGYAVGYFVFDAFGEQIVSLFGTQEQFESVRSQMEASGFWFVFSVGVIPIPFQIAMLAAGATQFSLIQFIIASALARGVRYFGLTLLVYFAGNQAQRLFEKHKITASIVISVIVVIWWTVSIL